MLSMIKCSMTKQLDSLRNRKSCVGSLTIIQLLLIVRNNLLISPCKTAKSGNLSPGPV